MWTISAFDVAVCNRSHRRSLLELFKRIPPFLDRPIHFDKELYDFRDYLKWIVSRKMAIQSLFLKYYPSPVNLDGDMDSLQSLTIETSCHFDVSRILTACPNLTALTFSTICEQAFHQLCRDLANTRLQKLTKLDVSPHRLTNVDLLARALAQNGQSLKSLRLNEATLCREVLEIVARCCPNLNTLHINAFRMSSDSVIKFCNSLKQLKAIALYRMDADEETTTMAAFLQRLDRTHITSFSMTLMRRWHLTLSAEFTQILLANPNLECLEVNLSSYNRTAQHLRISFTQLTEGDLRSILTVVSVVKLEVFRTSATSLGMVRVLMSTVRSTLTDLVVDDCADQQQLIAMLSNCPNLTSICLGYVNFNSDIVGVLSKCCKHLQNFELKSRVPMTQADFTQLVTNCHGLTEIKRHRRIYLTTSVLQAIVDSGVKKVLIGEPRVLTLGEIAALAIFWQLVKEKQRLPVPQLLSFDTTDVYELNVRAASPMQHMV